jgi:hypothetical protein
VTQGTSSAADKRGVELFYDFAITPAVRLNVSYQHVWNPLIAKVTENQNCGDSTVLVSNPAKRRPGAANRANPSIAVTVSWARAVAVPPIAGTVSVSAVGRDRNRNRDRQ